MGKEIDALVISVDEPQLGKCLESVHRQSFENVIHINGVSPESDAFNEGVKRIQSEWAMKIDGDMILYPDGLDMALAYMEIVMRDRVFAYLFGLYDTFIKMDIGYCVVMNTEAYKSIQYQNIIRDDFYANRKLRKMGWNAIKKRQVVVGTHFDNPDEFQIFRRFYAIPAKFKDHQYLGLANRIKALWESTKDPVYILANKALLFGQKCRNYETSRDINFDRKNFEEFKND